MDSKIKQSLLIIDDESSNLKVLTHILGSDYTLLTASNGIDGLERAKEYKPDLVLLDIVMPDMDGYQTFSELRKNKITKDIPVIFISGLDSDEYEKKGMTLDAADYISKPFKASVVKLRVRNHLLLKTAIKAAETANRTKSVFLAKMSHEIRTLLNSILRISGEYRGSANNSQEINNAFTRVYNSGDMMLGIINDILDMSRIEAGKLELVLTEYNIAGLINDIALFNIIKYEKKPIEFFLKVDENIPSKFIGDEVRIKHILNNLLSNAFKYTASGEVELSVSVDDSLLKDDLLTLVFRVRDTGQGMSEDHLSRLFDEYPAGRGGNNAVSGDISRAFYPELSENGQKNSDQGLGISILIELIKMMNGGIIAKSEPGFGSVFTVRLPQKNVHAPVLGKEAVEKLMNIRVSYENKLKNADADEEPIPFGKVLVVDDVDINQFVVKEMLSYHGLEIDFASGGEEAVEKVKTNNYDLVLMDYSMPDLDGLEATKQIRKFADDGSISDGEKFRDIPIIALTANSAFGVKDMILANGFNDFISKPVDLHEMNVILRKWLKRNSQGFRR